jgi:ankyrin repeat protein
LLEAGADANIKDTDANFPLILACFVGDVTVVQMLLSAGANVDAVRVCDGNRPNPKSEFMDGKTALIVAAEYQRLDIVRVLLDHGANRGIQDSAGKTALDYAEMTRDNADVVAVLSSSYS